MPDVATLAAVVLATALLVAIPGPNVALIVANSLSRGFRFGAATVLGTTLGVGLQLAFVVLGLAALLTTAASLLVWVKWLGVGYLIYLGITAWQASTFDPTPSADRRGLSEAMGQGTLLALINPKTLLFNAAFLPQFISEEMSVAGLIILASCYLVVLALGDLVWAGLAGRMRPLLSKAARWPNRITGSLFIVAGIGLALARTER